jgi:hypothetical protein
MTANMQDMTAKLEPLNLRIDEVKARYQTEATKCRRGR